MLEASRMLALPAAMFDQTNGRVIGLLAPHPLRAVTVTRQQPVRRVVWHILVLRYDARFRVDFSVDFRAIFPVDFCNMARAFFCGFFRGFFGVRKREQYRRLGPENFHKIFHKNFHAPWPPCVAPPAGKFFARPPWRLPLRTLLRTWCCGYECTCVPIASTHVPVHLLHCLGSTRLRVASFFSLLACETTVLALPTSRGSEVRWIASASRYATENFRAYPLGVVHE